MKAKKDKTTKQVVVISGASSGIGLKTATLFLENGYIVYNLSRRVAENKKIKSITCDITNEQQVQDAVDKIYQEQKRIDILINNAGFGISGSSENQDIKEIKSLFDVNFTGAVCLTNKILPIMRNQKHGKIINTGSVAGVFPIPFQSFYSATKSAIDIWSKALSIEVKPFGVQVCTVLVGDTKTDFTGKRQKNNEIGTAYEKVVEKSISKMEKDEQNGKDPITVAKTMLKLANKYKIPPTKTVGFVYQLLLFLNKILPTKFMLWVVSKLYS
ncbi:MAG: SDR family oxidoreductase [Clostridia bacterium]|nr:SDR family oxidoreductase [Clostridia bacterium]